MSYSLKQKQDMYKLLEVEDGSESVNILEKALGEIELIKQNENKEEKKLVMGVTNNIKEPPIIIEETWRGGKCVSSKLLKEKENVINSLL